MGALLLLIAFLASADAAVVVERHVEDLERVLQTSRASRAGPHRPEAVASWSIGRCCGGSLVSARAGAPAARGSRRDARRLGHALALGDGAVVKYHKHVDGEGETAVKWAEATPRHSLHRANLPRRGAERLPDDGPADTHARRGPRRPREHVNVGRTGRGQLPRDQRRGRRHPVRLVRQPAVVQGHLPRVQQPDRRYQSPIINVAHLTGLEGDAHYHYAIPGDTKTHRHFNAPPDSLKAGKEARESTVFAVVGDTGQTEVTAAVFEHIAGMDDADVLLHTGDLSYADGFPPGWDTFGRLAEVVMDRLPSLAAEQPRRDHERPRVTGVPHAVPIAAQVQRERVARVVEFRRRSGSRHRVQQLRAVEGSRRVRRNGRAADQVAREGSEKGESAGTPWIIVVFHVPWYNSNHGHFKEAERARIALEKLLYDAGVDVVLNGHVHSYERSRAVYDYQPNECGVSHLVVGDGGNYEGPYEGIVDGTPASVERIPRGIVRRGEARASQRDARDVGVAEDHLRRGDGNHRVRRGLVRAHRGRGRQLQVQQRHIRAGDGGGGPRCVCEGPDRVSEPRGRVGTGAGKFRLGAGGVPTRASRTGTPGRARPPRRCSSGSRGRSLWSRSRTCARTQLRKERSEKRFVIMNDDIEL